MLNNFYIIIFIFIFYKDYEEESEITDSDFDDFDEEYDNGNILGNLEELTYQKQYNL